MLERLFKNKKYLFLYLLGIFASFGNFASTYTTLSNALFGAFAEGKIPAIVMVITTAIIQGLLCGKVAVFRFLAFVIIFAIIKCKTKKAEKDEIKNAKDLLIKATISSVITEVLLILLRITAITDIAYILLHILCVSLFMLLFDRAFKYFASLSKDSKDEITTINSVSAVLSLVALMTPLKYISVFGADLWIIISTMFVMIYSWKNTLARSMMCALFTSFVIMLCDGFRVEAIICLIIVSIVTALLSRAGKKGAAIGIAVAGICLLVTLFNEPPVISPEMRFKLTDEYKDFLITAEERYTEKSGDEYQKIVDELANVEELEKLEKQAKNTFSSKILKGLLIGFLLIIILPATIIEKLKVHVELKDEFKKFREKFLKVHKIYRLNAGEKTNKE